MKNYNKILEAVNRGIQLALDDFDDENQVQIIKSKQIQNRDYTKEYLDLMKMVVDLGLPSGTLWSKYNLGAENEYDYGDYYAWGELTTKSEYSEENYIYKSKPKKLPPKCDIATQTLGSYCSIPTKEQCEELLKYTKNKWVDNYKGSSIKGRVFTGSNGNSIFIPASGVRHGSGFDGGGVNGYIQTSSLYEDVPTNTWFLCFDRYDIHMDLYYPYNGRPIRPVAHL